MSSSRNDLEDIMSSPGLIEEIDTFYFTKLNQLETLR